jgi:hypothetical protein
VWSDKKGISQELKTAMIATAHAGKTYKTWNMSESEIPLTDIIWIENLVTREEISFDPTPNTVSISSKPLAEFVNVIGGYI